MMSSEKREASPEASPLKGPAPKAVPEDTSDVTFEDGIPLSPMMGDQTVQFIPGAPANGDAKVEIGDTSAAPPTFVGLGKEELMKYANDPFWVRLRWFLFVLFWVLWIAMLVGAVVIIVLAPRCSPKKSSTEPIYQVKAGDLIKNGQYEQHAKNLKDMGVETIVVTDLLQHDPRDQPEAVTDFMKIDQDVEKKLFTDAMDELKRQGITLLLKLVPNHSGTKHEWFNDPESDIYVRKPIAEVGKSPWSTQDSKTNSWSEDPKNRTSGYLQQFSGDVADLNFKSNVVIDNFKEIISHWKEVGFEGFYIAKASYLVEDVEKLMERNATRNQPENVDVLENILGKISAGSVFVELDGASNETVHEYIAKKMTPVEKLKNLATPQSILESLEDLNEKPKVIVNLAQSSTSPEKTRLVTLLVSASGSRALLSQSGSAEDSGFLKDLLKFQDKHPRGEDATVQYIASGNVIAALRSEPDDDDHLILANFGGIPETFKSSSLNVAVSKGVVEMATPNAVQKAEESVSVEEIQLAPLSGLVIKLEKAEDKA